MKTATIQPYGDQTVRSQICGFWWDSESKRYLCEVCGFIVARFKTLHDAEAFCQMHHKGIMEASI